MELGTGVFLSTAMLSLVLLYGFTKDRWRWKRIILVFVLVLVTPVVLLIAIEFNEDALEDLYRKVFPPDPPAELHGIKLGMSREDVLFVLGQPDFSSSDTSESTESLHEILIYKFDYSLQGLETASVTLRGSRVVKVVGVAARDRYVTFGPIDTNFFVADVQEAFGQAPRVESFRDGTFRVFSYPQDNWAVGFNTGRIELLAIYDSSLYPDGGIVISESDNTESDGE